MTVIYKRIQELMEDKGLTASDFARELEEKTQRIRDIQSGRQRAPEDVMIKIVERFGVNAAWLLTGNGPIYSQINTQSSKGISEDGASYGEDIPIDFKRNWNRLNKKQKRELMERAQDMVENNVIREFVLKMAARAGETLDFEAVPPAEQQAEK